MNKYSDILIKVLSLGIGLAVGIARTNPVESLKAE